MLFAYTLTLDTEPATPALLRDAVDELNAALLPPGAGLYFMWDDVAAQGPAAGALRGYAPGAEKGEVLVLLHALRHLSRRFPEATISLSGGYGLMPSQLRNGQFELFADAYEAALAVTTGWKTASEQLVRIPS
ncbi:MAG: hypothetical protein JWM80_1331 [Cyanobacteria bacterium RYN_339]|nr:hypothetical protein [Cyanobacteria bacterium RYN_339]